MVGLYQYTRSCGHLLLENDTVSKGIWLNHWRKLKRGYIIIIYSILLIHLHVYRFFPTYMLPLVSSLSPLPEHRTPTLPEMCASWSAAGSGSSSFVSRASGGSSWAGSHTSGSGTSSASGSSGSAELPPKRPATMAAIQVHPGPRLRRPPKNTRNAEFA